MKEELTLNVTPKMDKELGLNTKIEQKEDYPISMHEQSLIDD